MICSTSFSSKAILPLVLFLMTALSGCGRYKTVITVFVPQPGEAEMPAEPVVRPETPPVGRETLITVLPVENLSGTRAPLHDMERALRDRLERDGFRLLDNTAFEQFRKKHRMRYIGGLGTKISRALLEETGAEAVLITSLEAYQELNPPKISLISRLVSSGSRPEILWIDSIGLSGDESPGLLDLTLVRDPKLLLEKAVDRLTASLIAHIDAGLAKPRDWQALSGETGRTPPSTPGWKRKYLPYDFFRSPIVDPERNYSIAVIPMLNLAVRKNAGTIVSLHYVRELFNMTDFKVYEPGVVREELLRFRAIMPAGPSLAIADLITGSHSLGVDLVFSGRIFDYQNSSYNAKVDFSIQVIEKHSREVVFGARTFSTGGKGVFFFDFGRVYTAHNLLAEMARTTTHLLSARTLPQDVAGEIIALDRTQADKDAVLVSAVRETEKKVYEYPQYVVITK